MSEIIYVVDPTVGQIDKMNKAELVKFIITQSSEFVDLSDQYNKKCKELAESESRLNLAESYIEQGRAMIEAITERWHEYDV